MWHYLHNLIGLPTFVLFSFSFFPSVIFACTVLFWRRFAQQGNILLAAFSLPCLWTSYEYIYSVFSPHSTFGSLAYSQMDFLPVIQIASLVGSWGIVFFLLLVPSTVAAVFCITGSTSTKYRVVATVCAVALFVLGFGLWRLHSSLNATGTAAVRLISSDANGDVFPTSDAPALQLFQKYTSALSTKSGEQPVDLILAPEKLALVSDSASAEAKELFSAVAVQSKSDIVVGFDEKRNGTRRNEALLFAKDGSLQVDYEKHHFIPVLEDGYVPGQDYAVLQRPSGIWGVAICKDMDFPRLSREYGKRRVGLLIVPAWDFVIDAWYHDRMAVLRGVESGFTIVRSAKQGLQTVSDNRGRLLLDRPGSKDGFIISDGIAPVAHAATLYASWGDWFAWLCVASLLLFVFKLRSANPTSI
jgi:apolipoprotein N-acyltransferase